MPTKVHRLTASQDTWNTVHDQAIGMYLDRECYAFARALHEGLGWPLFALMHGETIRHAVAQEPGTGLFRDVCGATTAEELCKTFGIPLPPVIREISDHELLREKEPEEHIFFRIGQARKTAEVLFPELPWRESQEQRMTAFVDALEKLSRNHGFWIRPMVPGSPTMISDRTGREDGYVISSTHDGTTFMLDRSFK